MDKIKILEKHCEGDHPCNETYIDVENDIFDGKASHAISAMNEYGRIMYNGALDDALKHLHDNPEFDVESILSLKIKTYETLSKNSPR